ncbi:MAG: ShlB/FhaC/HecB family hemolysin secretion/activation protein [Marinomonas sp.]
MFESEFALYSWLRLSVFTVSCCATSSLAAQDIPNSFESVREQPVRGQADRQLDPAIAPVVQSDIGDTAGDASGVTIGAVSVNSRSQIPPELLAAGYEQFIGQNADQKTLQELASAVSEAARSGGYVFASAQILPQAIKLGVVSVSLDPGAIDEVRIIGSQNKRLRKVLDKLRCEAARSDIVERQLLLAGDLPGITLNGSSYLQENGKGILVVTVSEDRSSGYASLDNHGPNTLGPIRARLRLDIAGLLSDSDAVTTSVISSIAEPKELTYVSLRYTNVLGDGDTSVGFSASAGRTRSGSSLRALGLEGRNRYASVFASHALKRSNDLNLWLNAELAYLQSEQTLSNSLFQQDEIVTASLNFAGNYNVGTGRIYGGIGVTQGLGILGANSAADPLSSRPNSSGQFTKAHFWINSILNLGQGFSTRLAATGQIASKPLLAPHEIAVGGPNFGRGFDYSERFGDEGILGLAEIRKDFNKVANWLNWLQVYGFVDGGYVSNIGTGFGDGSLLSTGGGFRAQIGKFDLGVEAAAPVNEDRFESDDRSSQINVQMGIQF